MIVCLVTDRRRLGAALGVGPAGWLDLLRSQVKAAALAGVDIVQLREPDLEARVLAALTRDLLDDLSGTPTRLVVNDRLDVALAAGAGGVHLRERSYGPGEAHSLTPPGFFVGCSVHAPASIAARNVADYFVAGTVLATVSKPGADELGWMGLRTIVDAAAGTPVLGIGGLDARSMPLLAAAGAAGIAAIGAFVPDSSRDLSEYLQERVTEMRLGFDSVRTVS
jgi:thiamine-phosphate pyrophosphorylase